MLVSGVTAVVLTLLGRHANVGLAASSTWRESWSPNISLTAQLLQSASVTGEPSRLLDNIKAFIDAVRKTCLRSSHADNHRLSSEPATI
ncbi:hypothetical protein VTN31DRAFT_3095 [Thermomyces dupontii]|uniref:uncharacterized protein n=1 Tax=Talaromyces thermophilus TaxID=28565 RepID=UPI003741F944